jgi:hypothetical protein
MHQYVRLVNVTSHSSLVSSGSAITRQSLGRYTPGRATLCTALHVRTTHILASVVQHRTTLWFSIRMATARLDDLLDGRADYSTRLGNLSWDAPPTRIPVVDHRASELGTPSSGSFP